MDWQIRVKNVSPQRVLMQRNTCSVLDWGEALQAGLATVWKFLDTNFESISVGPAMARIEPAGPGMCAVSAGFPVASSEWQVEGLDWAAFGGCDAATLVHQGPYERLDEARACLLEWAEQQRETLCGEPWLIFWIDPDQAESIEELRTELVWEMRSGGSG